MDQNASCDHSSRKAMPQINPTTMVLDMFAPGFSLVSTVLQEYFFIDVSLYVPFVLTIGLLAFTLRYLNEWITGWSEYFTCQADIRMDDEIYNMIMSWIANQKFAKNSRRFVANTNLNSRSWQLTYDEMINPQEEGDEDDDSAQQVGLRSRKAKELHYTPSFGNHRFWYKNRLFSFNRAQNERQNMSPSEREEISVSKFGRDPRILKELLEECRTAFIRNDNDKTVIYRGRISSSMFPEWVRCMSRVSRPFSTVVLDEKVKQDLIADMSDYLNPVTKRWYSNRGIPYRRGYLLYGPPGTGKSSLSFAIAGYFKLKIYIISLNSSSMTEETLNTLFAELPSKCVVLLEDIDTAGLTHTREATDNTANEDSKTTAEKGDGSKAPTQDNANSDAPRPGKLSLSALLNVIDGVASQEGRVLIMTTNHLEKLDSALIRPGRVDLKIRFKLADAYMMKTIFKGIFATMEGDQPRVVPLPTISSGGKPVPETLTEAEEKAAAEVITKKTLEEEARISELAVDFAKLIPNEIFSPAELQGYLMKHKHNPEAAIEGALAWVKEMEEKKVRQMAEAAEKERKEAELKIKEEAEQKVKEEAEKKVKEEEEKKVKEEVEKKVKQEVEQEVKQEAEQEVKQEAEKKASKAAEKMAKEQQDQQDAKVAEEGAILQKETPKVNRSKLVNGIKNELHDTLLISI